MSDTLILSIDLTKIDKSKINNHQNGSKYYTLVVRRRKETDNYGNTHSVANSKPKDSDEQTVYIGSGKAYFYKQQESNLNQQDTSAGDSELPF